MHKYEFYLGGEWHYVEGDDLRVTETGCTVILLNGTGVASVPPGVLVKVSKEE